jgi:hypothetical protein
MFKPPSGWLQSDILLQRLPEVGNSGAAIPFLLHQVSQVVVGDRFTVHGLQVCVCLVQIPHFDQYHGNVVAISRIGGIQSNRFL